MTQLRTLTKNLAGEQDVLLRTVGGPTEVVQQRASGPLTIRAMSLITLVNTADELRNVTPDAFELAIMAVPDAAFSLMYYWKPANVEDDDGYNIIKSIGAVAGNWVLDTNFSIETSVIAQPAGTQLDSPVISKGFTVVETVASALDSVLLPIQSIKGVNYKISNPSANDLNVFPQVGDSIHPSAVNLPSVIAAGDSAMYLVFATSSGVVIWYRF